MVKNFWDTSSQSYFISDPEENLVVCFVLFGAIPIDVQGLLLVLHSGITSSGALGAICMPEIKSELSHARHVSTYTISLTPITTREKYEQDHQDGAARTLVGV